ncbi:MAG TPA: cell division topological specificity factor MinE [Gammaproteobacteria bacterium]|nr:cell division topological specificity factor MinE [Gammaproteobacteria bacterium]
MISLFRKLLNQIGLGRHSAKTARERLQIVVSHQRAEEGGGDVDFLPRLRNELLSVICKYVKIDPEQVNVQLQRTENCSVLELNIALPNSNQPLEMGFKITQ